MVIITKFQILTLYSLLVLVLAGCATTGMGDLPEQTITDIGVLEGKWTGSLTDGTYLVSTIKSDGSWKNVVKGKIFVGKAAIKDGKVLSESFTTGGLYHWLIYEEKGQRIMVWSEVLSGETIAKTKFQSVE